MCVASVGRGGEVGKSCPLAGQLFLLARVWVGVHESARLMAITIGRPAHLLISQQPCAIAACATSDPDQAAIQVPTLPLLPSTMPLFAVCGVLLAVSSPYLFHCRSVSSVGTRGEAPS